MTLKELYEKLGGIEGGAEMEAVMKTEITTLRNEAARARTELTTAKKLNTDILSTLELQDGETVLDNVKGLKGELDAIRSTGKKPDELAGLVKDVASLRKQLEEHIKAGEAEKAKAVQA